MRGLRLLGALIFAFVLGGFTTLLAFPHHSPQIAADPDATITPMQQELDRSGPLLPLDFSHNMF